MMKLVIVGLLVGLLFCPVKSHGQVTANVLERVLYIGVEAETPRDRRATAFTLDVDGRQYLITAKHVVAGLKDEDTINVYRGTNWTPLHVRIFKCEDPIDIAVLIPAAQLTPSSELEPDPTQFFYGQEAYFVGFPYGIFMSAPKAMGDQPVPFIKRAAISSKVTINAEKHAEQLLLDGYNNPGFSGGPIVYRDMNKPGVVFKVAAVVSGFIPEVVPVMKKHDIKFRDDASPEAKAQPWRIQQRPDKSWFEYEDTDNFVALNTGIVQGYLITPAVDLIRQHPSGPVVAKQP
jgi:S1-C subfamily serine protease